MGRVDFEQDEDHHAEPVAEEALMAAKDKRLPVGAALLAQDGDSRVFRFGDQVVVESTFAGRRIETRLPADLEWLWSWHALLETGCDRLATLEQ